MDNRKIIIASAAALAVVAVLAVYWFSGKPADETPFRDDAGNIVTRTEVPDDVFVPFDTSSYPTDAAVPKNVMPALQNGGGSDPYYRDLGTIDISNDAIATPRIFAREGDVVHLYFRAVDKAYDLIQPEYGFQLKIEKGQTRLLEFGAMVQGQFLMYCQSCGGPERGPRATLVIVPRGR